MPGPIGIGRAIRATRRARDIIAVLIKYGFNDLVEEIGLDRAWAWARRMLRRSTVEPPPHLSAAERVRRMFEELGPTFVKLGQVLSTRPDLVPEDWCREFAKLQSEAAALPYPDIEAVLQASFGSRLGSLVASIEQTPLAAASIAQVHRAKLPSGEAIVLKVVRPGIRDVIEADLQLMRTIAGLLERRVQHYGYSPVDVVEQFSRHIAGELDLTREGRATERLQRAFEDDANVRFPRVEWSVTSRDVLALEEIRGELLSRLPYDDIEHDLRMRIVQNCADAVFRQCLELGFFHADPHPGNIFVFGDGSICFIDCGMTGHVSPDTATALADLVRGTITKDLDTVVRTSVSIAGAEPSLAYDRQFRAEVWAFIGEFEGRSLRDLQVGALLHQFFDLLRRSHLRCPADLVYLIKSIATIEGVALGLAPDFDLIAHVQPLVERLVRQRYGFRAVRRRVERSMLGYAEIAEQLPFHVRELFDRLQRKHLTLNVDHRGLDGLTEAIDSASMTIGYALVIAGLMVGSAVLMLADNAAGERTWITLLAVLGFVSSFALAAWRVFRLWIGSR